MLRRRIEKLEAHLPLSTSRLLETLDRRALNTLCFRDRQLVSEMLSTTSRRKAWSLEHRAAEASYRKELRSPFTGNQRRRFGPHD
jgi:hypothetical protein